VLPIPTINDVRAAVQVIRQHISPPPLIRSYVLERELKLPETRRVWLSDYGWTPSGSFKLFGGLNWMANNLERIGNRPVAAHSSGNFASGIAFAGMRFKKRQSSWAPQPPPDQAETAGQGTVAVIPDG
jgi:threonine dehydratase